MNILIMMWVPLLVSALCWLMIGGVLRQTLVFLCPDHREEVKEISGLFWQRIYLMLTFSLPLLCVLLFAPYAQYSLETSLLYALRWSIFGGVFLLLTLAYLVRRQIKIQSKQRNIFGSTL